MPFLLDEGNAVMSMTITDADEDGVIAAGDKYILFIMDSDAVFGENGDFAIIGSFANTHERSGEAIKGIDSGCSW